MRLFLWSLTICSFLGMCSLLEAGASKIPMDKLGLHKENYNEIVRDLIKNWESPIVYLRQLGYLPSDYEDTSKIKPNLDALMSRMERDDERESLGQDGDKSKQLFCGTADIRTKKKRENVLKLKFKAERRQRAASGSQGVNYPSVDQMLAMKQPSLAVAMSAAKVDELMPKQKPADHHSTCNSQVILLSSLLAKQQPEQVQQHTEMNRKTDDFLQRLVAKTSPQQTETQVAATAGNQATQLVGSLGEDAAKRTPEILPSNRIRSEDTNSLSTYPIHKSIDKPATHSSTSSRQDAAQSKSQIDAPRYLNWDIASNKLKQISVHEKNAYVDKLVRIFVQKQENQGNPQNPM